METGVSLPQADDLFVGLVLRLLVDIPITSD